MILFCMDILLVALVIQAANTFFFFRSQRALLFSNLALRQQLAVYKRKQRRPGLKNRDRLFWAFLSRLWSNWKSALVIVKPDTIMRWQKKRFTAIYVFVIMHLGSRKVVHVNVTEHPTLAWVKQQIRDANFEGQPKFLIHDNDGIFGQLGKPVSRLLSENAPSPGVRSSPAADECLRSPCRLTLLPLGRRHWGWSRGS
jgi:hypothetical protein